MDIIKRIEAEIERLNRQILKDETFQGRESVNLNGLVCLLRYAAWRNPNELKNWFTRDKKKYKITVNPGIVKRFSLSKPKGNDGAQLRIHIFDHAEETAKHNHQRSFITMCIQGSYEYRYYHVNYDNPKEMIKSYFRPLKENREIDENGVSQPFKFIEEKMGEITRVQYDRWDSDIRYVTNNDEQIFDQSYGPMFVDNNWFHTVHSNGSVEEPVITVLIRRQKEKDEDTLFIRTDKDTKFENEPDTEDADEEQIETMWKQVSNALTKGSTSPLNDEYLSSNAITEFMNPVSKIIRVSQPFIENKDNFQQLQHFLRLNDFSICPITKRENGLETLVKCIDEEGTEYFTEKTDSLDPKTPIMFGILYTVLSPKFVVPIVDEKTNEFYGLLSLFDILSNLKRFATSIITASLDINTADLISPCANLIQAVNKLHDFAKENRYELKRVNPEVINDILMPLGDLLLNGELSNLMITDNYLPDEEGTWVETISKYVFNVDENCKSPNLLKELKKMSDFDNFAQRNAVDGSYDLVSIDGEDPLDAITEHADPSEVLRKIRDGNWPLFVNIQSKNQLNIISTEELFSHLGTKMMATNYQEIVNPDKNVLLNKLLLKGTKRHPSFTSEDFDIVPEIFSNLE